MRSLFGGFCGLLIGIIVSLFMKNNQLFFAIVKEHLSLILIFSVLGCVIGMISISQKKVNNTTTYYDMMTILSLAAMGVVITVFTESKWGISILYLFITTILWGVFRWVMFCLRKKEKSD